MPLDIRPLDPALQKVAREELNEDPAKIEEAIEAFRDWIRKSPHLRARTDDQFLVTFLRATKYSMEKAKKKLDMFYTLRTHIPELMLDRDPYDEKVHGIIKLGIGLPMPHTETPGSPRIILIRHGAYDPNIYTIQDVIKVATMMNDILLRDDDNVVVAGQIGILDLADVTCKHFMQYHPTFIKKMQMMSEEGSPLRQKQFHYINTPNGFEHVFNVFKSLMQEKNQTSLHIHGSDLESLYKFVPRRLLPTEYGGEAGSLQEITDEWEQKILSYRQYFEEDEQQFGVNESKRVGQVNNPNSLFGLDGSYNQFQCE